MNVYLYIKFHTPNMVYVYTCIYYIIDKINAIMLGHQRQQHHRQWWLIRWKWRQLWCCHGGGGSDRQQSARHRRRHGGATISHRKRRYKHRRWILVDYPFQRTVIGTNYVILKKKIWKIKVWSTRVKEVARWLGMQ